MESQMTDPMAAGQELQGQILETIRRSQEAVTDAIRTWAEAVQAATSSLPVPSVPFADKLSKPDDLVANAYDFAEHLLAAQRKFAEDVLQAAAPALGTRSETEKETGGTKKTAAAK
jgi:ABC-type transporter Mla subunit MlaD